MTLAPLPLSTLVVVPLSVPVMPLHDVVPLTDASVVAPVTVDRPKVIDALPLARHVIPKVGSLIKNAIPLMLAPMVSMFGSVPVNLSYLTCHGSVSLRTVAAPLAHLVIFAAVINPDSVPTVFEIVL
ncbi:MAG: hypothetical protein ACJ76L_06575 [Conexibacter sp.]